MFNIFRPLHKFANKIADIYHFSRGGVEGVRLALFVMKNLPELSTKEAQQALATFEVLPGHFCITVKDHGVVGRCVKNSCSGHYNVPNKTKYQLFKS